MLAIVCNTKQRSNNVNKEKWKVILIHLLIYKTIYTRTNKVSYQYPTKVGKRNKYPAWMFSVIFIEYGAFIWDWRLHLLSIARTTWYGTYYIP